jgi:hypothetical protein
MQLKPADAKGFKRAARNSEIDQTAYHAPISNAVAAIDMITYDN